MKFVNAAAWIDPEHASMCFHAHGVIPVKHLIQIILA